MRISTLVTAIACSLFCLGAAPALIPSAAPADANEGLIDNLINVTGNSYDHNANSEFWNNPQLAPAKQPPTPGQSCTQRRPGSSAILQLRRDPNHPISVPPNHGHGCV